MFLQGDTRICHIRKVYGPHIILDVFPALIAGVPRLVEDIMVVNVGTWYDPGNPGPYRDDVQGLAEWMQRLRVQLPRKLMWADTPPQHFQWEMGYAWKSGFHGIHDGDCVFVDHEEHRQGGWDNIISRPIMQAIPIAVLNTFNITTDLWQWHVGKKDCTHFCHPSTYEIWLVILQEMLDSWPDGELMPRLQSTSHQMW